jgi:conjugative transfer region protein TrbK
VDGKTLARISAIAFVALAITATAIDMGRSDAAPGPAAQVQPSIVRHDALDEQLTRCSLAGEVGAQDPQCLKAWAANRRRFLGEARSQGSPETDRPEVR